MRGPRERLSDVSLPSEFGSDSAGVLDSAVGIDTVAGGRFLVGRLRGRMISPRT